jgi:uncharacterized repeat protein (TIGR02543 family)
MQPPPPSDEEDPGDEDPPETESLDDLTVIENPEDPESAEDQESAEDPEIAEDPDEAEDSDELDALEGTEDLDGADSTDTTEEQGSLDDQDSLSEPDDLTALEEPQDPEDPPLPEIVVSTPVIFRVLAGVAHTVTYEGGAEGVYRIPAVATVGGGVKYKVAGVEPLLDGYTFSGWRSSATGNTYQASATFVMTNKNVVLTAQWIYNGGGGGGEEPPITPPVPRPPAIDPPAPIVPPAVSPSTLTETNITEPAEPEAATETSNTPVANGLRDTVEGFSENDLTRLESQSGNVFSNLANGNIPLGNFFAKGAWSLVSLLLALIAVIISIVLFLGAIANRGRNKDLDVYGESEARKKRKSAIFRALTIIAGIVTLIVWLVIDDPTKVVAWINQWTLVIAIIFVVQIILFSVYRNKIRKEDYDGDEQDYTQAAAE